MGGAAAAWQLERACCGAMGAGRWAREWAAYLAVTCMGEVLVGRLSCQQPATGNGGARRGGEDGVGPRHGWRP